MSRAAPPSRLIATLLGAATLAAAAVAAAAVPAEAADSTVTVNLAAPGKVPARAGAGFLYGLTQNGAGPADGLLQPLRPTLFRGGGARIAGHGWLGDGYRAGTGYRVRVTSAIDQARRVTAAPYDATYHLLVSDVWGADTEQPATTVYPCDNGDCANWRSFITQLVTDVKASGVRVRYDIWNEPDGTGFWPRGVNSAQYFQMWNTAVAEIRRLDPAAVIVGPSYSGYNHGWLDTWLARTKADGTLPGVLNWHFGNDPLADSNDAKAIMAARGVGPLPMTIDEYLFSQQQQPGYLAWYLARLAPSDVSGAAHAIWSDCCTAGTLDSVLWNGQPTGQWWVYRAYAQLTGNLVPTSGGNGVAVVASADQGAGRAVALLGNQTGQTGTTSILFTGVPAWLLSGGRTRVTVQRIPNQSPLSGPVVVSSADLTVTGGSLTVPVTMVSGTDAYTVTLGNPIDGGTGGGPSIVDANSADFTYGANWGVTTGVADMYAGTANWSFTAGSTAQLPFTGTRVALHAVRDVDQQIIAVSVDGGAESLVDNYAPTRNASGVVWTSPILTAGAHTLRVRVTGTKHAASSGWNVAIDSADVTA
ncbi:hypothetical protein OHA72_30925 [Dactylosporangium sp. NBC_01737]|uniref:hypothetical protein n=1 Tax=Dactylosporangium sp. NBC_01737 TaxID=2975959 RepID=UPI002E0EF918|nr:hypothetical protein OHA72_30925 [Dactylosporangium sp. NBC_01737]